MLPEWLITALMICRLVGEAFGVIVVLTAVFVVLIAFIVAALAAIFERSR